jgi:hypothetical protein
VVRIGTLPDPSLMATRARRAAAHRLPAFEPAAMPVSLLHAGQALVALKVRSFVDFAAPRPRKSLGGNERP